MVGVMQATGTIKTTWPSVRKTLTQQAYIGVLLGGGLSGSSSSACSCKQFAACSQGHPEIYMCLLQSGASSGSSLQMAAL